MKREATVLILQDRSVGIESRQDDIRRLQVFAFLAHASNSEELDAYLSRSQPDVILYVADYFPLSFVEVQTELLLHGLRTPIVAIVEEGKDLQGMDLVRTGATDFVAMDELDRIGRSIYTALRIGAMEASIHNSSVRDPSSSVEHSPTLRTPNPPALKGVSFAPTLSGRKIRKHQSPEILLENLLDIVTELDSVGTILYESASAKRVLGFDPEELEGRNAFSLIHPLDIPRVMPVFMLGLATPGVPHSARFRFRHKDGGWRWLESVGTANVSSEGQRKIIVTSRDVTQREGQASAELGETNLRFMAVVEGLGEGVIITDNQDQILYANHRMSELTGFAVSDLLGSVTYQLFLPQEYWPLYRELKAKWLEGGHEEYELAIMKKDGSPLCTHVNISTNRSLNGETLGLLMAFTDITHRKEAEAEVERAFQKLEERVEERTRELSESRERLHSMAEAMPQMVWVAEANGAIEYVNQRTLEYAGLSGIDSTTQSGLASKNRFYWSTIVHASDLDRLRRTWKSALKSGNVFEIEYRLRNAKDGEYRWHIGRATPMRAEDGSVVRWFGTCTDIHDLKLAEEALKESHSYLERRVTERTEALVAANQDLEREIEERLKIEEDLRKAKVRAEVMNQLKTNFLANMSHEIRTPLTSILGFASVLTDGLSGTEMFEFAERIEKSGHRLLDTMNAIMDLARTESNEIEFDPQPVALEGVIESCVEQVREDALAKHLEIVYPKNGRTLALVDEHYLRRTLFYLLNNAIKFTHSGSITVLTSTHNGSASVHVRDTGIGISREFLPHIFDEFKQESSGYARNFEGTGLGLTLSKRFVESMGGEIRVESVQGEGSSFIVVLPSAKSA